MTITLWRILLEVLWRTRHLRLGMIRAAEHLTTRANWHRPVNKLSNTPVSGDALAHINYNNPAALAAGTERDQGDPDG